ncbi:hypothetical protein BH09PSE6_BH09PSE6_31000 [soil metagenome]
MPTVLVQDTVSSNAEADNDQPASQAASATPGSFSTASNERFLVGNPREIAGYLQDVIKERVLCSLRAAGKPESFLSHLISIDERGQLIFDAPRAPVIVRSLVASGRAAIEFTLADVRIAFEAEVIRIADHQGDPAVFVKIPASIYRFQRRDNYRVSVPQRRPVRLSLDLAEPALRGLRLADLSCGGASIILKGALEHFPVGRQFETAELVLEEDDEPLVLTVRVRHAVAIRLSGAMGDLRIGVQFVRTPPGFEPRVSRLVNEIARDLMRIKQA